jgi:small subunit ribosomal protein S17
MGLRIEEGNQEMAERTSRRKVRVGTVVSDKMDKTIVVNVETRMPHPLYGKIVRRSKRYTAHDEENQCGIGDLVRIMETRPISRTKRWRLVEIVEKAE